jgi:membrane peptidoglycan carboxypeptidase
MRIREIKQLPSLRKPLLKIHRDLFAVATFVTSINDHPRLNKFEKYVLLLEDRRFFRRGGVDLKAIARETLKMLARRRHGGASTIDMQFVRTATGYKQRRWKRKLYEIFLASIIQYRFSKIIILRSYLDNAYFGSGLKGAWRASQKHFDKEIEELTEEEACELASMLVYPRPLFPTESWRAKIARRSSYGLSQMRVNKDIFDQL